MRFAVHMRIEMIDVVELVELIIFTRGGFPRKSHQPPNAFGEPPPPALPANDKQLPLQTATSFAIVPLNPKPLAPKPDILRDSQL